MPSLLLVSAVVARFCGGRIQHHRLSESVAFELLDDVHKTKGGLTRQWSQDDRVSHFRLRGFILAARLAHFDVRQLKDSWTPANQAPILHQITKPVSNSVASIAHSVSRPSNSVTQVEDAAAFLRVGHYCLRGYVGWFHKKNGA